MNINVVIPTVDRAATVRICVDNLARQTRKPNRILIVAVSEADVAGAKEIAPEVEVLFSPKGLCIQRNQALRELKGDSGLIVMIDDDFLMDREYLAQAEVLFENSPKVVGCTGTVLADGINGKEIMFDDALQLLKMSCSSPGEIEQVLARNSLYGCNMIFRSDALSGLYFDENLPLYGWQEDLDFSSRLRRRGLLVRSNLIRGIHLGVKAGRTPGKRLGYSQVSNPIYIARSGNIPRSMAAKMVYWNVLANIVRSICPEVGVDRFGRLRGNLLAMLDLIRGRLHPRRILDI